jgi:hypothetical protein
MSKNSKIQQDFIDIQNELKTYIESAENLPLMSVVKDPMVVPNIDHLAAAYKEVENLKTIKKNIKRIQKLKKKNIQVSAISTSKDHAENLNGTSESEILTKPESYMISKPETTIFSPGYVDTEITKEKMYDSFKVHMKKLSEIPRFNSPQPTFVRNLTASASHQHLIKKIEKAESPAQKETNPRMLSEITGASTFRNGILRNVPPHIERRNPNPFNFSARGVSEKKESLYARRNEFNGEYKQGDYSNGEYKQGDYIKNTEYNKNSEYIKNTEYNKNVEYPKDEHVPRDYSKNEYNKANDFPKANLYSKDYPSNEFKRDFVPNEYKRQFSPGNREFNKKDINGNSNFDGHKSYKEEGPFEG